MRGYRRPLDREELDRLVQVYDRGRQKGQAFEAATRTALSAILVSPNFLFRIEADQPTNQPYRLSDYELATRMSYFLWASMPDEELFRLAGEGRLHEPAIVQEQVSRMIRDPKSKVFTESFASQWLRVRELKSAAQPDPHRFPDYTPVLREAMYREVIEFFDSVVRDDESLFKVLAADYSFLNAELAALCGIGREWRGTSGVQLKDERRGGIRHGRRLTLTSYPQRTSPVLKCMGLEEILGTPPPPPPPLVKSLPPDDAPWTG